MGKKKFIKWLTPLCLGIGLFAIGSKIVDYNNISNNTYSTIVEYTNNVEKGRLEVNASSKVNITDINLKNALLELLGKDSNSQLYSDDFLTHDDYKAVTATDPNTGIETTDAKIKYLNLSNYGITNIIELCQFEFPSTLSAIDLSNNGITNEDLTSLNLFVNLDENSQTITHNEKTYTVRSNIADQFIKINLNYNKINLQEFNKSTLNSAPYNKYLFGVQNMPEKLTTISPDNKYNPKYYIRSDDTHYLAYTLTSSLYNKNNICVYDEISDFLPTYYYGKYTVVIKPHSQTLPTNYFYDSEREYDTYTIRYCDVRIKDSFWVERKDILKLNNQLIWFGFDDINSSKTPLSYTYSNASTKESTNIEKNIINSTTITFTVPEGSVTVLREFIVKDTIKPIITLNGKKQEYFMQFDENYSDLGANAIDPDEKGGLTGDNISHKISTTSTVKIGILGDYTITYNVNDGYGNSADPVVRNVSIVERTLSSITVHPRQEKLYVGDILKFTAKTNDGVVIKGNYTNITYDWYLDGSETPFYQSLGNSITGQGECVVELEKGKHTIKVVLKATQVSDGSEIEKWSSINIDVENKITDSKGLIIACAIAIGIILLIIIIIAYLKTKKSKTKTHKNFYKHKKDKNAKNNPSENNNIEIQVIKDYTGNGSNSLPADKPEEPSSTPTPPTNDTNNNNHPFV